MSVYKKQFSRNELATLRIRTAIFENTTDGIKEKQQVVKPGHGRLLQHGGNTKMRKGTEELNVRVYGLSLMPAARNTLGVNLCTHSTAECRAGCIVESGHARAFPRIWDSRRHKTDYFVQETETFLRQLFFEVAWAVSTCERQGLTPVFRLNVFSDIDWSEYKHPYTGFNIFEAFPKVQFYGYTKVWKKWQKSQVISNWHLTFSYTGKRVNAAQSRKVIELGGNVAVVFSPTVPNEFMGTEVIDGDKHDMRFIDPAGTVVGLRLKSSGYTLLNNPNSDFVVTV